MCPNACGCADPGGVASGTVFTGGEEVAGGDGCARSRFGEGCDERVIAAMGSAFYRMW